MACYYIVISSAHLRNGHFRNIKGVFRGPLSKNGDKTLDYAEKENTIAKALEDLKANFYCELCDKQYYKHQEFDNHINSYDHAHKQRLKELKQREFARNVASKSRKDERKQEKALQRLHKLAELRKEAACAPGSGPMFKSTTVTVRDNFHEIPQSAITGPSNKLQNFNGTLMHNAKNAKEVTSSAFPASQSASNNKSDSNKLGDQVQGAHGHKIGFSFAFPKKASVKLESSAAVFYEYSDETSSDHEFSRRSRFLPGACNLQSPSATEIVVCSEEKQNYIHPLVEESTDTVEASEIQESKELSTKENIILKNTVLVSDDSHLKQLTSDDLDGYYVDNNSTALPDQSLSIAAVSNQTVCVESNSSELSGKKSTALDITDDCISLQDIKEKNDKYIHSDSSTTDSEIKKTGSEILTPSYSEGKRTASQNKNETHKRLCEPFVPVLSKHGSSVLQWPSEMLIYTCTEPSVSYSCNPLCFDFKSSRTNNITEKTKHQSNIPHSHHKTESNQSTLLDDTDGSSSECADYKSEDNKNICDQATSLRKDFPLAISCEPATNQDKMCLDASFRLGKTDRYHISKNHLGQDTMVDDKHNKVWTKETHKRWFHKNRKRKRRRKLCHHHHKETANADEVFSTVKQEINYVNEDKHEHLQSTSEKCRDETGSMCLTEEQLQQSCKKLGTENSEHKTTIIHGDKEPCDTRNTKNRNDHFTYSEPQHRKYRTSSHRQSKQLTLNSGSHNLMFSRALCSCRVRRSNSNPDHKCLENFASQSQPIKRAYDFLTDETERSHQKRRQHTYSCSSDESTFRQDFLPEEHLRQTSNLAACYKAKRRRRRKKPRIHQLFVNKERRRNENHSPSTCNSTLNILGELLMQENIQQTKVQFTEDYAKNVAQTTQMVEKKLPLQSDCLPVLEHKKSIECSAMESSACTLLEDLMPPVPSVVEHDIVTTATSEDTLEKEKKHENVKGPESQAAYKVPGTDRNVEQTPHKSYLCHYEIAETIPPEKINEATSEWLWFNSGTFDSPLPFSFKEAHIDSHTFFTTDQILAPFTLPDQTLIFPPENHGKVKDLQRGTHQQLIQQNMLANKVKLAFPPTAIQPYNSPHQPLSLQQPLCSTSVTTIHHTVLQQHAAAAAAAASTFKVLQPHQQFLSQVPALLRTPLPHLTVGPRLCPGTQTTFVAPPQLPLIPTSVLHPNHLAFAPLPHTLFPSLLSPHPAVIPLQPLF
ncbi:zinc finger protein 804A [Carettochelys insculpta]|uniref:zinc finger protein 804A n=1 Tax=Carettochelys insculpta TaxID=44489 RepID=UPI003EB8F9F6